MNEIVHRFLFAGEKFMSEMYLRQPRFTYSACGQFIQNKELIQKFKETEHSRHIYWNKLGKSYFQYDMAHKDFKDLPWRSVSVKILCDKTFDIAKKLKYDGYQIEVPSLVYEWFDKKHSGANTCEIISTIKNETMLNQQLAELPIPIIEKIEKRKA